jgi:hypothetical protein
MKQEFNKAMGSPPPKKIKKESNRNTGNKKFLKSSKKYS